MLKRDIPYWLGSVLIAALNTLLVFFTGHPWGITSVFALAGAYVWSLLRGDPTSWGFISAITGGKEIGSFLAIYGLTWLNLGIILGVIISSSLAGEWKFRRGPRKWKITLTALGGGFLMGYGARIAMGCNVGALLGGISSFSLHGWVFGLLLIPGVLVGIKLWIIVQGW